MKAFTLKIQIQEQNTPQKWEFEGGVSGIEQLAIWRIVEALAKTQQKRILEGPNPKDN